MNNNIDFFEVIKGIVVIVLAIMILAMVKSVPLKLMLCVIVFACSLAFDKFTGGGNI